MADRLFIWKIKKLLGKWTILDNIGNSIVLDCAEAAYILVTLGKMDKANTDRGI